MRRLRMLLITTALMAGSSALAWPQQAQAYQDWGFQDRDRDWDRDHDGYRDRDGDWYRDRGGYYGRYGNRYYASARQYGYQDGFNDGRNDRYTGHSFRPSHDSNYKHADHGFYGGDRNYYKQMYRQAYEQGYQQGYNSGGYGRGRGRWWHW
jgi:hypothetical protein